MVSALKVDGKRLYKLAREGITVERKARDVTVHTLEVLAFDASSGAASLRVECSKGTYIRSIVTDIGEAIGCGAHVTCLRRTHVSPFHKRPWSRWKSWKIRAIRKAICCRWTQVLITCRRLSCPMLASVISQWPVGCRRMAGACRGVLMSRGSGVVGRESGDCGRRSGADL